MKETRTYSIISLKQQLVSLGLHAELFLKLLYFTSVNKFGEFSFQSFQALKPFSRNEPRMEETYENLT
jgi:hypothetical protein